MRRVFRFFRLLSLSLGFGAFAHAKPLVIDVPAQPADVALLALSGQAHIEVLFSSNDLHQKISAAVVGSFEPTEALARALRGTGYAAHATSPGKFAVTRTGKPTTTVTGRLLGPDGKPARSVRVALPAAHLAGRTDENGDFVFLSVPPGTYELIASASGFQTLRLPGLEATADTALILPAHTLQAGSEPSRLAPFVVESTLDQMGGLGRAAVFPPRTAVGNLDLQRTEHDAIPFTIFDREHIRRSGVVNLNEYLQRELLDSDASSRPPEQDAGLAGPNPTPSYATGSSNLSLRGFDSADETIILVNGRRLPEVLTSGSDGKPRMPDVNFIPLSLVQQVEVLPISASSLYNGNPVGGVINIVLRPGVDANSTELTATYNNAFRGFDAPQTSLSLLNSETLLGGALRLRFNVATTSSTPATEAELGYHRRNVIVPTSSIAKIHRATPNLSSADLSPLFGPGTSPRTSVAPGSDGQGGIAAFSNRQGSRNLDLFKSPGGMAASLDSSDYPYGREQKRNVYFGSVVYDVTPWLQLGVDATLARTTVHRGYDVFAADLSLAADSPFNPFKKDLVVSLNETARDLGQHYDEARLEFSSIVLGALIQLPREWRLSLDAQYAHNVTKYRGIFGADTDTRWQGLVDRGRYNPLRDTQVFGPPAAFYDEVLVYRGYKNQFSTIGDFDTLDAAFRVANESLQLPTGLATLNAGADYRRSHLAAFREQNHYADGSAAGPATDWADRVLQRYSIFGELRAPLLPARWMPSWLHKIDADLAVRYVGARSSKESYVAPTLGLKLDFDHGFSFRSSLTTSSRYPTPKLNLPVTPPSTGGVAPAYTELITDPKRGGEQYAVPVNEVINPFLLPESAVTQAAGLLFQRGKVHRVRLSLDFVDTRKTNEDFFLGSTTLVKLEAQFPDRVLRGPNGVITQIYTGRTNLAGRHSQNWNGSFDYAWNEFHGGTLELYGRLIYFELFQRKIFPGSRPVDELASPDGVSGGLQRYRSNFGVGWSNRDFGFGIDGRYFSPRVLPVDDRLAQGHDRIRPAWQFDTYVESDVGRWFPWDHAHFGLRAQLRVNNVFGDRFPKYVAEPSGSGVQPYGDWRGRTYSLSLTANF